MDLHNLADMPAFDTEDGSRIRELAGPQPTSGASEHQSLAEATLAPGGETAEHYHLRAEELYYVTGGTGKVRLGTETRPVRPGDCIVIPPGVAHKLWCTSELPLSLLCCCAPPYSPDDTVLTGG